MGLVPTGTGKLIAVFDHVTIRASDRVASERFYDSLLRTFGIERTHSGEALAEWDDFSLAPPNMDNPAARQFHIGFVAPSRRRQRCPG
jgi:hypothetical protein